jgi:signal transduction histidine kinase/ligand-binding sensor domain-containing protein
VAVAAWVVLWHAFAQSSEALGDEVWRFRSFDSRSGMASAIVRDVLQAKDGSFWFATMAGLTRYDPKSCRYQNLSQSSKRRGRDQAMALAEDRDGALWVATQGGGVGRFKGGVWVWYTADNHPALSDEVTSLLVDRQNSVWATLTTGGMAVYAKGRWTRHGAAQGLAEGEIGRCTELRDGSLACGTYHRPVLQVFLAGKWSQLLVKAPSPRRFYVHAIDQSPDGQLWLATKGAGVLQGRPEASGRYAWTVHDQHQGLASDRVGAILVGRDGAIWAATAAGVSVLPRQGDGHAPRWTSLSERDGLASNHVFSLYEAKDGAIWIATLGGGASRYGPSRWTIETTQDGLLSDNLSGGLYSEPNGALWVGTDRGLSLQTDNGSWQSIVTADPERDHINQIIGGSTGEIWVATRAGVRLRRASGQWQDFPARALGREGPRDKVVRRLALDHNGALWAATGRGLSRYHNGRWTHPSVADGLPSAKVNDVRRGPDGRIWIATDNGIARRDDKGNWQTYQTERRVLRTQRFHALALDHEQQLWASGLMGIGRFYNGSFQPLEAHHLLPEGIYSRFVMATANDRSLWVAIRGRGILRNRDGHWTRYSTTDGLAFDTIRDVLTRPTGEVLFATRGGGLSRYRPDLTAPETFFGNRTSTSRIATTALANEPLVIPFYGEDRLKDTPDDDLLFSYRVDGQSWSAFRDDQRISLRLPPGRHLVEVRAMDRDLNIDPTPARHELLVLRPWWAQPLPLSALALCLLLASYAGWRTLRAVSRERSAIRREQQLVKQQQRFVRLASHELRKPLSRLGHRAELLALPSFAEDAARARRYADEICQESRGIAQLVERLLDHAKLEEGLALAEKRIELVALVRQTCAEFHDRPALVLPSGETEIHCKGDPLYLSLALRNLVDNAEKYGGGLEQTRVEIVCNTESVSVSVSDKGPGVSPTDRDRIFDPFQRGDQRNQVSGFGLGLSFSREIARAHGGDLCLEDNDGGGARFVLHLPLGKRGAIR